MSFNIPKLVKGGAPTFLTTGFGNRVIEAVNSLGNIQIYADTSDRVEYSDEGVYIYYEKLGLDLSGEFTLLDSNDITKAYILTFEKGTLTGFENASSNYITKSVELCEGDSTSTYEFVVKDE